MSTNFPIKREMTGLLKLVQAEYDRASNEAEYFRKKCEEFRRDEEIQRLENEIKRLERLSLHVLSDKEREDEQKFRHKHYISCNNGNSYEYELVGTGIGTVIAIRCPVCDEREDITDTSCW